MEERILKMNRPTVAGKKYTAIVINIKTKKQRKISCGALGYPQYKDPNTIEII